MENIEYYDLVEVSYRAQQTIIDRDPAIQVPNTSFDSRAIGIYVEGEPDMANFLMARGVIGLEALTVNISHINGVLARLGRALASFPKFKHD